MHQISQGEGRGGQGGNLLLQLDLQGVLVNRVLKSVLDFFLTFCDTQQSCEISELNSSSPLGTHEQWHKTDSTHYNITVMDQMDGFRFSPLSLLQNGAGLGNDCKFSQKR